MNDSQILSTFADLPRLGVAASVPGQAPSARPLVWDACQLGVVLRAVLFVQAVTAVGVMFVATAPQAWLMQTALLTAGTLPATLLWLLLACAGRQLFSRWPMPAQWVTAAALGAAALCGLWNGLLVVRAGMQPLRRGVRQARHGSLQALRRGLHQVRRSLPQDGRLIQPLAKAQTRLPCITREPFFRLALAG